jgi:alpha-L-arabinofuranosidase
MIQQRAVFHTGLALGLSLLTLAGCQTQTPGMAPGLGSVPENNTLAADSAPRAFVAAPLPLKAASVSASVNPAAASRVIDGSLTSAWDSGTAQNPSITIQLPAVSELTDLSIKVSPGVGTYTVETSADGATWKVALANQANTTWNNEIKKLPTETVGKSVRLTFNNAGKKVMLFEASLRGAAVAVSTGNPVVANAGPTIDVTPAAVLHAADSHVLGTNRNHVTGDFPNAAAKLAKVKELQPTWGSRKYLYRIGHGPTDGRNDYSYMTGFHFEKAWNQTKTYPYDDIREGLKEAATLGADQMHVVNFGTSDPAEAGRYVSYLNKATDANRTKYPFAQQNVRMFELGNEIAWSMVRGHDKYASNERVYAERAKLFAQEMRKNSDVPILIGANASINSNWEGNGWSGGAATVKNILTIMGDQVDFLLYHGYPSWPLYKDGDLTTLIAQNAWNDEKITREIMPAIKAHSNGRNVRIANTEFFTHLYNDVTRSRGMFGALYSADTVTLALKHNMLSSVQFAMEHKDMADASFFINNDANNTTAIFKFQKMLAQHWGDSIVKSEGSGIPTMRVNGASTTLQMPKLSFVASKTGSKVFVMVTHRTNDADLKASINVGFTPKAVTAYELSDPNGWNAANATVNTVANPSLTNYTFKKASVTIFEISQ